MQGTKRKEITVEWFSRREGVCQKKVKIDFLKEKIIIFIQL